MKKLYLISSIIIICFLFINSICFAENAPYYYKYTSIEKISNKIGSEIYENITSTINKTLPIAYCTFVELDNFEHTSSFGKIIGDSLGEYLSRRGYKVIETQLRVKSIAIKKDLGQFGLTRDMNLLRKNFNIQALLVGTYELVNKNSVYISAKLISTFDNSILSSCSFHFGVHNSLKNLFQPESYHKKKIKKINHQGSLGSGEKLLTLDSTQDIRTIQNRLKELGLYEYKIDGIWGKRSKKALKLFKKAHGLAKINKWDLKTQKKLFKGTGL